MHMWIYAMTKTAELRALRTAVYMYCSTVITILYGETPPQSHVETILITVQVAVPLFDVGRSDWLVITAVLPSTLTYTLLPPLTSIHSLPSSYSSSTFNLFPFLPMPNNLILPKPGSKSSSRPTPTSSRSSTSSLPLSFPVSFLILVFGKLSRVFSSFISFHYLQHRLSLPLYLFFVTLGASLPLLLLQRPWTGKRLGPKRTRRLILSGGLLALTLYLFTAGLRSAGPLRVLLIDGSELPLLYLFAVVTRRELPERRKTRGALFMLLAYVLLLWDASGHVPALRELEQSRLAQRAEGALGRLANVTGSKEEMIHGNRRLKTTWDPPVKSSGGFRDMFVEGTAMRCEIGVMLVLTAAIVMQSSRAFTRRLATEVGGAKRHFALAMTAACGWLTPLALVSAMSEAGGAVLSLSVVDHEKGVWERRVGIGEIVGFCIVGFLWLVLPYYVRAVVSRGVGQRFMVTSGVMMPFLVAVGVSGFVGQDGSGGGVSWILIAAFFCSCIGVAWMMAGGGGRRGLSELPVDNGGGRRGEAGGRGEKM